MDSILADTLLELDATEYNTDKIEKALAIAFETKECNYLAEQSGKLVNETLKRFNQVNIVQDHDVYDCMLSRKLSQTETVAAAIVATGRGQTWQIAIAEAILNYADYHTKINEAAENTTP